MSFAEQVIKFLQNKDAMSHEEFAEYPKRGSPKDAEAVVNENRERIFSVLHGASVEEAYCDVKRFVWEVFDYSLKQITT